MGAMKQSLSKLLMSLQFALILSLIGCGVSPTSPKQNPFPTPTPALTPENIDLTATPTFNGTPTLKSISLTPAADAYITIQDKDGNYGQANKLIIYGHSSNPEKSFKALMKFDLQLPETAIIQSIKLSLVAQPPRYFIWYSISKIETEWIENEVTWNQPKNNSDWHDIGMGTSDSTFLTKFVIQFMDDISLTDLLEEYTANQLNVLFQKGLLIENFEDQTMLLYGIDSKEAQSHYPKLIIEYLH